MPITAPYESPRMHQVTGPAIRPGGLALTKRALAHCRFPSGARVLDVGCGLGATAGFLRKHHRLAAMGLDASSNLLGQARSGQPGLPLIRARAADIPLRDRSLCGLFCECVLSLMDDPVAVLEECRRVLIPKGYLVLSDIYVRRPEAICLIHSLPVQSCIKRACRRERVEEMVKSCGFDIRLWEDHSESLKRLAAQLVFAHGSLASFWEHCGAKEQAEQIQPMIAKAKLGYYLLVARKETSSDG